MSKLMRPVIEIERKFKPHPRFVEYLTDNKQSPRFKSVAYLGRKTLEERYFDHDGLLEAQGVWVRLRDGKLEAKHRQGGDFLNSNFLEYKGRSEVWHLLMKLNRTAKNIVVDESLTKVLNLDHPTLGLAEFARFNTVRDSWRLNNRFEVVLDETDFGHRVGEVELEMPKEEDGGKDDADHGEEEEEEKYEEHEHEHERSIKTDEGARMDKEIEEFMNKYEWAFPREQPVGKLSAYFMRALH